MIASAQVEQIELPTNNAEPRKSGRVIIEPISLFFASSDRDGDAIVTEPELGIAIQNELENMGGKMRPLQFMDWSLKTLGSSDISPRFLSFDTNFDSVISESEFSARLRAEFSRLDKNEDGQLERSEMIRSLRDGKRQSRGGNAQGRDGGEGPEGREGRRGGNGSGG